MEFFHLMKPFRIKMKLDGFDFYNQLRDSPANVDFVSI